MPVGGRVETLPNQTKHIRALPDNEVRMLFLARAESITKRRVAKPDLMLG